jgi:hypothetical protein
MLKRTFILTLVSLSAVLPGPTQLWADSALPVVKVAIQEGGDERETPIEYDSRPGRQHGDFWQKYSGVVKIKCPFGWSSGNLVYKNDLLVTVAHAFHKVDPNDAFSCLPVTDEELSECYIQKMGDNRSDREYVKLLPHIDPSTIKHPLVGDCTSAKQKGDEVAWVRLTKKVLGAKPFAIHQPAAENPQAMVRKPFVRVAAINDHFGNFPKDSTSIGEDTRIGIVEKYPANYWYVTSGSVTHGNSGGGLFMDNETTGEAEIFGVMASLSEYTSDGKAFSQSNYNVHAAIQGQVADMIRAEAARPYGDTSAALESNPGEAPGAWASAYGSTYTIRMVGSKTLVTFEKPSDVNRSAGVKEGSVMFEGTKDGNTYNGVIYIYSPNCGSFKEQIRADISDDQSSVTFHIKSLQLDSSCHIVKQSDANMTLVYSGNS